MKIYLFDVDHTLDCAAGPIPFGALCELHLAGNCVGLCGNWAAALNAYLSSNWRGVLSFIGPMTMTKVAFMSQIRNHVRADEYILVGNDPADFPGIQVSQDSIDARAAGFRFIKEKDFAGGAR